MSSNYGNLFLALDHMSNRTNQNQRYDTAVISVTFSGQVDDVSFTIFDVDEGAGGSGTGYIDRVAVVGSNSVTSTGPFAPNVTTPAADDPNGYNFVVAPGVIQGDNSADSNTNNGNAYFEFNSNNLTQFTITYSNEHPHTGNSNNIDRLQWIGLHNITFTPVPEPSTYLLAGAAMGGLFWWRRRWKQGVASDPASPAA